MCVCGEGLSPCCNEKIINPSCVLFSDRDETGADGMVYSVMSIVFDLIPSLVVCLTIHIVEALSRAKLLLYLNQILTDSFKDITSQNL